MRNVVYLSIILLFFTSFYAEAFDSQVESVEEKYITSAYGLGYNFSSFNADLTSNYQKLLQSEGYTDPDVFYNISSISLDTLKIVGKLPEKGKISAIMYFELSILIQAGEVQMVYKDDYDTMDEDSLSYFDGGVGLDLIGGPGINYHPFKGFYLITVGGAHLKGDLAISSDSDYSFFTTASLGIGAVIKAEYRFPSGVGVMLGVDYSYDPLSIQYGLDSSYFNNWGGGKFSVKPSILVTITKKMRTKLKRDKITEQ